MTARDDAFFAGKPAGGEIRRGFIPTIDNFTIVPNAVIRDQRLKRASKMMWIELVSHEPGWRTSVKLLAGQGREGAHAVRAMLTELIEFGYLRRGQERNKDGTAGAMFYELLDGSDSDNT